MVTIYTLLECPLPVIRTMYKYFFFFEIPGLHNNHCQCERNESCRNDYLHSKKPIVRTQDIRTSEPLVSNLEFFLVQGGV